jgi:hypothetical protein
MKTTITIHLPWTISSMLGLVVLLLCTASVDAWVAPPTSGTTSSVDHVLVSVPQQASTILSTRTRPSSSLLLSNTNEYYSDDQGRRRVVEAVTVVEGETSAAGGDGVAENDEEVVVERRIYSREASAEDEEIASAKTATTKPSKIPLFKAQAKSRVPFQQPHPLGNWEFLHGNYVLRPKINPNEEGEYEQPRALIHFVGGAMLCAAPQVTYRYLLERLASKNFLIVTTPCQLSFNHLKTCDEILEKFENIAPQLAREYGAIPVIGAGHSLGGLLQVLITSLFPDTPRAGNIIMSYNSKPIQDAVPFFEEVFTPLFVSLADSDATSSLFKGLNNKNSTEASTSSSTGTTPDSTTPEGASSNAGGGRSSVDGLNLLLAMARTATQGQLPSDELLQDLSKFATPPFLENAESGLMTPSLSPDLRSAIESVVQPQVKALKASGVLPLMDQLLDIADQVPSLIQEVAEGARDFVPPPASVAAAARRAYRARRTLLIQYENDPLDESEQLQEYLLESERIMRMKRPMIRMDVQLKTILNGPFTHATPAIAPPLDIAEKAEDILGNEASEKLLYQQVDETVEEMVKWLEATT